MQVKEKDDVGTCPTCGKLFSAATAEDEKEKEIVLLRREVARLREKLADMWG